MRQFLAILFFTVFCTGTLYANSKTSGIAIQKTYEDYSLEKILSLVKSGDANAQYDLAERYHYGKGGVERDQKKALKWVRLAAKQNNSGAQNSLGFYYYNGLGVERNQQKALHYFNLAAEQGHRIAIFNIGVAYMMGEGVNVNQKKAAKLFRKSEKLGYIPAKVRLGYAYDEGAGTFRNKEMAFKLYREAALAGEPNGQINLAGLYYAGGAIPEDLSLAMMWITVAAMNGKGYITRSGSYQYLLNKMSGEEITKAKNLAAQCFKSHYKECAE